MTPRDSEHQDDRLPFFWWAVVVTLVVVAAVVLFREDTTVSVAGERVEQTTTVPTPGEDDLLTVLSSFGGFDLLVRAVEVAGMRPDLMAPGGMTLFAPGNAAFAALPADVVEELFADPRALRALILNHLADGRLTGGALAGMTTVEVRSGEEHEVGESGLAIGPARILIQDELAENGVIHAIDTVLLPEPVATRFDVLVGDGGFRLLAEAVEAAGLGEAVSRPGSALLAPSDAAFADLPDGVLERLLADPERLRALISHHLVPDGLDLDVEGIRTVDTAAGTTLEVEVAGGRVRVGGSEARSGPVDGVFEMSQVLVPSGFALATVNEIVELEPITFEFGSAELTPEGTAELDRVVTYLLENPVRLEVGGHTDSDGSDATNQALSEARANSVRDYLVDNGVDPDQVTATGYGESRPVADNETAEGRARNRRIEFTIVG